MVFAKYTVVFSFLGLTSALLRDGLALANLSGERIRGISKDKSLQNMGNTEIKVSCRLGKFGNFYGLRHFEFSKDNLGAGLQVRKRDGDGETALKAFFRYFLLSLFHCSSGECVLTEGENACKIVGNTDFAADRLGDSGCDILWFCLDEQSLS